MNIKVLGSGCANCKKLFQAVEESIKDTGVIATVEKVEDFKRIAEYGVMRTPALVIDEKVVVSGRIPTKDEIKNLITKTEG